MPCTTAQLSDLPEMPTTPPSSPQIGVDAKGRVPPNHIMTIPTHAGSCQLKKH